MALKPRADHRFTIEHYGMSTPEMARRLSQLGGAASVNRYYVYYRSEFNAPFVGSDAAYTAARLRTLVEAGVPTSLHTDTPVAPPIPLEWWSGLRSIASVSRAKFVERKSALLSIRQCA